MNYKGVEAPKDRPWSSRQDLTNLGLSIGLHERLNADFGNVLEVGADVEEELILRQRIVALTQEVRLKHSGQVEAKVQDNRLGKAATIIAESLGKRQGVVTHVTTEDHKLVGHEVVEELLVGEAQAEKDEAARAAEGRAELLGAHQIKQHLKREGRVDVKVAKPVRPTRRL